MTMPDRIAELMALKLKEFAQVTNDITPSPCNPGQDPATFLRNEPQFAEMTINELGALLARDSSKGLKTFSGWVQLAAIQAAIEENDGGDRP
ncbi:hypothetical protein [Leptolyngbya sp. FACHB-16]|uniref:hypothetical protein n=1 Tax=unclassified Leptolyngbya TaxID=2650499 RepID=UPI0016822A5E|nr:hypothetical protein [Leptolyngbya sp. FACHB-16]MBD2156268.1 hypothetical protein [Leptolyngbya sp. FACHB-16]